MAPIIKSAFIGIFFGQVAWSHNDFFDPTQEYEYWISRCEKVFSDVVRDPSNSGGLFFESFNGFNVLCMFGSLSTSQNQLTQLNNSISDSDLVVVMSSGGPVHIWLELALILKEARPIAIIDRVCASSCANYIIPIAAEVLAVPGSLIIWHGGPERLISSWEDNYTKELRSKLNEFVNYTSIQGNIFEYSNQPGSVGAVVEIYNMFGVVVDQINGYALSPDLLKSCFGFENVERLWHPGGNLEVFSTGRMLNSGFNILESPTGKCP